MPKLSEVSKSWPQFKRGLRVRTYQPLTARIGKHDFEVVRVSRYWASADEDKATIPVKASVADRRIGFVLQFVRDTGSTVAIENTHSSTGAPEIIIEPGEDWETHLSARLRCSSQVIHAGFGRPPFGVAIQTTEQAKYRKLKRELKRRQTETETLEAKLEASERQQAELQHKIDHARDEKAQQTTTEMTLQQTIGSLKKQLDEKIKESREYRRLLLGRVDQG
jgi:hypothetical protein